MCLSIQVAVMALKYIILTAPYEKTAARGYDIVREFDEMWP